MCNFLSGSFWLLQQPIEGKDSQEESTKERATIDKLEQGELILQGTFRNENLLQERKKQQKGKEAKIQCKFKPLLDAQSL